MKPLAAAVVAEFEADTGVTLQVQTDTAGALLNHIQAGEAFDVALLTDAGVRRLAADGRAAQVAPLARVGIGVAGRRGDPVPPMASVEDFVRAVRAARKLACIDPCAGGSSGIYLQGLFQRLGLTEVVAAKAVLVPGGLTALRLVSGEADLAVQQASELPLVDGVSFVGMLPDEIQNFTTYGWAVARSSAAGAPALSSVAAPSRQVAAGALKSIGIEPPRPP